MTEIASQTSLLKISVSGEDLLYNVEVTHNMEGHGQLIRRIAEELSDGSKIVVRESGEADGTYLLLAKHDVFESVLGQIPRNDLDEIMGTIIGEERYANAVASDGSSLGFALELLPAS